MESLSDATAIVERMLVPSVPHLKDNKVESLGAAQAERAWELLRKKLAEQDMTFLAEEFLLAPEQLQQKMVMTVAKFMQKDPELASQLQQLYDDFLMEMYRGKFNVEQNVSVISNVSGVTQGGKVIGIKIDTIGGDEK